MYVSLFLILNHSSEDEIIDNGLKKQIKLISILWVPALFHVSDFK